MAKFLTYLFNPLLMPSILIALLMGLAPVWFPGVLNPWLLLLLIFSGSFMVPVFLLLTLRNLGLISGIMMRERRERPFPMFIVVAVYGVFSWMLWDKTPTNLYTLFLAITVVLAALSLLSLFWKVSAHATAISGSAFFLVFLGIDLELPWVVYSGAGMLVLTGLVMWARLQLKAHSPAQVWAGFALGLIFASSYPLIH